MASIADSKCTLCGGKIGYNEPLEMSSDGYAHIKCIDEYVHAS